MAESRIKNTKRNLIVNYTYIALTFIFSFVSRTIIKNVFSEEYLGLSSLFSSILNVLNMAELGFSSAIVYHMYKPLATDDVDTVCALLRFYKKIYRIIGLVVLCLGLAATPFLPFIIKGSYPGDINVYVLFILYLLNTTLSYWLFSYKTALLNAVQRMDLCQKVYLLVNILQYAAQIISLVVFKNYYFFVAATIISTCLKNITIEIVSRKKYPQYVCKGFLTKETKKDISAKVRGLLVCNISSVTYTTFDSIILSALLGLTAVAIYNNYLTILTAVFTVVQGARASMQASVGNSIAKETVEKNHKDMLLFQFFFNIIGIFCGTMLITMFQPFMVIWMGPEMLLSLTDVIMLASWAFITTIQHSYYLYLQGNGLWEKMKIEYIVSTIFNIIFNIVLGKLLGTTGIIISSLLATLFFSFFWESKIIFKNYFKNSGSVFYLRQLFYTIAFSAVAFLSYLLCSLVNVDGWLGLFVKAILSIQSFAFLTFVIFHRTPVYKDAKAFAVQVFKRS